jgi:hypothetical protein
MAEWIDNRMAAAGIKVQGVGDCIVHLAGARTRDIVQVARRCYDRTAVRDQVTIKDVEHAFEDIIAEEHDLLKVTTPTGYDFDSPFFKGWVVRHTLSDIGLP